MESRSLQKEELTLGELEPFTGFLATVLFPFLNPRITGQETFFPHSHFVIRVNCGQSTSNAHADRDSLTDNSTTSGAD